MENIYLKVTRDYTPNAKDTRFGGKDSAISVEKGDIIFDVRKDEEAGWLCGKNLNSGKTGRFPSDCVAKLSDVGEKDNSGSDSSPKSTEKKEANGAKPQNRARPSVDTKASEPKRTTEPTGSLRRPPNPRPFGLSSRYPRPYEREKKESSGDSGVVEDEDDYYLNDNPPEKKKPLNNIRKVPSESETIKKPSIYESRFGNKPYGPVYSTRPSVSKLKSAFLDNDQKNTKPSEMKGKEKPKESIEMTKKPSVKESPKEKGKVALAKEDEDNDGMYACAELDDQKPSDVNKNKKSDPPKESKDSKINIKDNPLSKEKTPGPTHSYQVPQAAPEKPPRGGCSECQEPHIYAAPDLQNEPPSTPEAASEKYDFDPSENQQKQPLKKQENGDKAKEEAKRRSYNRMASYESISNVGPEKNSTKGRSTESIKDAVKAVKKAKARITSSDRFPRMRIIAGIFLGILTGVFIFFLFFAVLLQPVVVAAVSGVIIGLVVAMILGFLDRKRLLCIILLIFPSLFAARGKIALWILIAYFVMAGPVCNLVGNISIIALSRGECFITSSAVIASVGNNKTNATEANPSYVRARHPLFQKYIDTTRELQELVNNTQSHIRPEDLDPSRNKSTPRELCIEFLYGLRNNCIAVSKREESICRNAAAPNPQMLHGCTLLKPPQFCASLSDANISSTCQNADFERCEKFVNEVKRVLHKAPRQEALAAYDYGEQPVIYTPARKRCDNATAILTMLLPLLILLILYEAYSYHKLYLSRNNFDNQYLTNHFKTIEDNRKDSGAKDGLLPLKKCEHQKYIQPTSPQFTIAEKQDMLKYLVVYVIFLVFALIFILGDYYLYYVVSNTADKEDRHDNNRTNSTNRSNSTNNTGPAGAGYGGITCAPLVLALENYYIIVLSVLLGMLLLMILIQPYVLRLRHYIASRLYRRRERKRIAYLYYRLLEERKAFFKAVIDNISIENEENYAMDHLDVVRVLAWNFQTMETIFSFLGVSLRRCMVCGRGLNRKYIYCETDTCESIYCRTCFYDLGNKCLGCMRDSNPLSRSSSFIQGSSRKRKNDTTKGQGV